MYRASNAFSVLQATAAVVGLAILLWSLGLPSIRIAEAASVSDFSVTLSDSAPSVASNQTITFVTPTGMVAGETITITYPVGEFGNIASLTKEDFDLEINGVDQEITDGAGNGAEWGVTVGANSIDIESGSVAIGTSATVTIEIGDIATASTTGDTFISNPASTTSFAINVQVGAGGDTGETRVAIVDNVTVTASVDTIFTFTVSSVAGGTQIGSGDTTGGGTTATSVPFGVLDSDTASTAAQQLEVETNAANGFVVTVTADSQLTSDSTGADIDGFPNGTYTDTPLSWGANPPGATVGNEEEYGHWGLTSNDTTLTESLNDFFSDGVNYVSASTSPVEVFRHNGPTDGSNVGEGNATVGYRVEISPLQEAADDYNTTLTYVATPVF
jgi:hypothetical protein